MFHNHHDNDGNDHQKKIDLMKQQQQQQQQVKMDGCLMSRSSYEKDEQQQKWREQYLQHCRCQQWQDAIVVLETIVQNQQQQQQNQQQQQVYDVRCVVDTKYYIQILIRNGCHCTTTIQRIVSILLQSVVVSRNGCNKTSCCVNNNINNNEDDDDDLLLATVLMSDEYYGTILHEVMIWNKEWRNHHFDVVVMKVLHFFLKDLLLLSKNPSAVPPSSSSFQPYENQNTSFSKNKQETITETNYVLSRGMCDERKQKTTTATATDNNIHSNEKKTLKKKNGIERILSTQDFRGRTILHFFLEFVFHNTTTTTTNKNSGGGNNGNHSVREQQQQPYDTTLLFHFIVSYIGSYSNVLRMYDTDGRTPLLIMLCAQPMFDMDHDHDHLYQHTGKYNDNDKDSYLYPSSINHHKEIKEKEMGNNNKNHQHHPSLSTLYYNIIQWILHVDPFCITLCTNRRKSIYYQPSYNNNNNTNYNMNYNHDDDDDCTESKEEQNDKNDDKKVILYYHTPLYFALLYKRSYHVIQLLLETMNNNKICSNNNDRDNNNNNKEYQQSRIVNKNENIHSSKKKSTTKCKNKGDEYDDDPHHYVTLYQETYLHLCITMRSSIQIIQLFLKYCNQCQGSSSSNSSSSSSSSQSRSYHPMILTTDLYGLSPLDWLWLCHIVDWNYNTSNQEHDRRTGVPDYHRPFITIKTISGPFGRTDGNNLVMNENHTRTMGHHHDDDDLILWHRKVLSRRRYLGGSHFRRWCQRTEKDLMNMYHHPNEYATSSSYHEQGTEYSKKGDRQDLLMKFFLERLKLLLPLAAEATLYQTLPEPYQNQLPTIRMLHNEVIEKKESFHWLQYSTLLHAACFVRCPPIMIYASQIDVRRETQITSTPFAIPKKNHSDSQTLYHHHPDELLSRYPLHYAAATQGGKMYRIVQYPTRPSVSLVDGIEYFYERSPIQCLLQTYSSATYHYDQYGQLPFHITIESYRDCKESRTLHSHDVLANSEHDANSLQRTSLGEQLGNDHFQHLIDHDGCYMLLLQDMLKSHPESIQGKDHKHHIYPFQLAALGSDANLNVIYTLLRHQPSVIASSASTQ